MKITDISHEDLPTFAASRRDAEPKTVLRFKHKRSSLSISKYRRLRNIDCHIF